MNITKGHLRPAHGKTTLTLFSAVILLAATLGAPNLAAALSAPSLAVSQQGQTVNLNWSRVPEAGTYTLYYTTIPYSPGNPINSAPMGSATSFFVTLDNGGDYYVAVKAANGNELSAYSNIEEVHVAPASSGPAGGRTPPDGNDPGNGPDEMVSTQLVDTGQQSCYSNSAAISCPQTEEAFYGQDASYSGNAPSYRDNGDGTVTDLVTGLMWQQDPGAKLTYNQAVAAASSSTLAGYNDWRLPTVKELYSLIQFDGRTGMSAAESTPYIDTNYFVFQYGDESQGERFIDAQYITSTLYVSTTMNGNPTMFGVNFADGRIKGYPYAATNGSAKTFFMHMVRGNEGYGENDFVDNRVGTITDQATGLMWQQNDSGYGMTWEDALAYCENSTEAGYDDWRLPNAKELQSIIDYSRSPDTTDSAAIDPVFNVSTIVDEGGDINYPFFWSGTTHLDGPVDGKMAVYVAFGEALGWMKGPSGNYQLMDVHGAGAQRSDPKIGNPDDYPYGFGPQGDVRRIENHVRCVRTIE